MELHQTNEQPTADEWKLRQHQATQIGRAAKCVRRILVNLANRTCVFSSPTEFPRVPGTREPGPIRMRILALPFFYIPMNSAPRGLYLARCLIAEHSVGWRTLFCRNTSDPKFEAPENRATLPAGTTGR